MSKDVFTNKEQLCQSFWQSVKEQKFKAKKIERGVNLTPPPPKASRVKLSDLSKLQINMFTMFMYKFHNSQLPVVFDGYFLPTTKVQNYIFSGSKTEIDTHHTVFTKARVHALLNILTKQAET